MESTEPNAGASAIVNPRKQNDAATEEIQVVRVLGITVSWSHLKMVEGHCKKKTASCVKRTSLDTAIHEQNGYAKVCDEKYTFKTNVDNSDTTYTDKHNMREV